MPRRTASVPEKQTHGSPRRTARLHLSLPVQERFPHTATYIVVGHYGSGWFTGRFSVRNRDTGRTNSEHSGDIYLSMRRRRTWVDSVLFWLGVGRGMSPSDETVEIDVEFDDGLLVRIDRLRHAPGYDTRSDVVAAAIEAAGE